MSNQIYFSNSSNRWNFRQQILRLSTLAATSVYGWLLPRKASQTTRKLLTTPVRLPTHPEQIPGMKTFDLETREGQMQCYRLGYGPTLLLAHGWSGSSRQFFGLMQILAKQGYQAIAFDQPAHGASDGDSTHLPSFIHALEDVIPQIQKRFGLIGLITHSMGGVAAANMPQHLLNNHPIVMIAPVIHFFDQFRSLLWKSGYNMRLFDNLLQDIAQEYEVHLPDLNPGRHLASYAGPLAIVHDTSDRFAPFDDNAAFVKAHPHIQFYPTQGLGHNRVIDSEAVVQAVQQLFPLGTANLPLTASR